MSKKSIRFFNDREVRAVWDDENNCWWFSATDVVRAINDEPDYTKAGNYWRWLKRKLGQEGIQLVSATHGFKFEAPDGKQRKADVLNSEGIILLAKHYPNNRAAKFLDWFTYSDNTIDGQSRKKAYTLFESGLLNSLEPGSMKCLQQIHAYLFGGLYEFAGQIRTKNISKGGFTFANCLHFSTIIPTIERIAGNDDRRNRRQVCRDERGASVYGRERTQHSHLARPDAPSLAETVRRLEPD